MEHVKKLSIGFYGGTGTVTGANFLITYGENKFLVDCGLLQGTALADRENWDPFLYDPSQIEILFITHAHIDHIGRIPKLYADGFRGRIISTDATRDLAAIMLADTVQILGKSEEYNLSKIYTAKAVAEILNLWEGFAYHTSIHIKDNFNVLFKDSGHILGSAMLEIRVEGKVIVFTGDLGNSPSPLLRDTEAISHADYLIMESVYGDRNHEHRDERKDRLIQVIQDNYDRKGTLIIPTFSLERTQELLFEINDLVENNRISPQPIFLDSPLGIHLTDVFKKYVRYFNDTAQTVIKSDKDIFSFPGLEVTLETEESKHILSAPNPKIIIAGSGMSNGGRIIHHEKNYLPDPNNTILLAGYQSMGTLGRLIEEGAKEVTILRQVVPVRAHIEKISGYSGHKDMDHLVEFVGNIGDTIKKVFVVMGEPKSSLFLSQRLRDYVGVNANAPDFGDVVTINLDE